MAGDDDSGSVLFMPEPQGPETTGFYSDTVRGELWHGPMPTLEEWKRSLGIDVRPISELPAASERLPDTAVALGADLPFRGISIPRSSVAERSIAAARRVKDAWELQQLRLAARYTVAGFEAVIRELKHAMDFGGERWLQATFERSSRVLGNGPGYVSIVGAGKNAAILHWKRSDSRVQDSELVLLDAGVETNSLYTADVTRTFPANGRYTADQRALHDYVETAHRAAMAQVRPGKTFNDMRSTAYENIASALHEIGVLHVSVDEAMSPSGQQHRRYLASGTGHHIGLDVHDCARITELDYLHEPLEPGMVLAVEPGMYFQANDLTVPPELRGIGVRIEDNLIVTPQGHEVITSAIPINAAQIEIWMSKEQLGEAPPERSLRSWN